MEKIQAEIAAIRAQIEALRLEKVAITGNHQFSCDDSSPLAIAEAYRRFARENAQLVVEVKGIDDAIAALELQLKQKQADFKGGQMQLKRMSLQEQVEEGRQQAKVHAERINELAAELALELRSALRAAAKLSLKSTADQLSVAYWQVYYKPFITGFKTISVPHVRSDGDVWTIVNRVV